MHDMLRNILLGIPLAAPIGPSREGIILDGLRAGFPRPFLNGVGLTLADSTYLLLFAVPFAYRGVSTLRR
jgi:threonine/homoserine/homoserine lactone efflux protein